MNFLDLKYLGGRCCHLRSRSQTNLEAFPEEQKKFSHSKFSFGNVREEKAQSCHLVSHPYGKHLNSKCKNSGYLIPNLCCSGFNSNKTGGSSLFFVTYMSQHTTSNGRLGNSVCCQVNLLDFLHVLLSFNVSVFTLKQKLKDSSYKNFGLKADFS